MCNKPFSLALAGISVPCAAAVPARRRRTRASCEGCSGGYSVSDVPLAPSSDIQCRLPKEKAGGGGGCFNRINATPKKDSSHLALLNCKPEPMIYNDNRQFNQGIHNLLLCDGCCFPMAAGERPNSEERAQCRAFWLTQESSGSARTARGITTVRASRLRLLRAFSAVAARPPGISYKRGIVAGCASRCE